MHWLRRVPGYPGVSARQAGRRSFDGWYDPTQHRRKPGRIGLVADRGHALSYLGREKKPGKRVGQRRRIVHGLRLVDMHPTVVLVGHVRRDGVPPRGTMIVGTLRTHARSRVMVGFGKVQPQQSHLAHRRASEQESECEQRREQADPPCSSNACRIQARTEWCCAAKSLAALRRQARIRSAR